jgi:hypothetical protein
MSNTDTPATEENSEAKGNKRYGPRRGERKQCAGNPVGDCDGGPCAKEPAQ